MSKNTLKDAIKEAKVIVKRCSCIDPYLDTPYSASVLISDAENVILRLLTEIERLKR